MPNVEQVVAAYIKLRDDKKQVVARQKEEIAPLNGKMNKLEGWLHRELNRLHAENIRTELGTVYKATRSSVKVQDWEAFLEFVQENDLWHMLDKRANKTAVQEFMEGNEELPPGLSIALDETVNIRR